MAIQAGPDLPTEIWAKSQYFLVQQVYVVAHVHLQSNCFSLLLLTLKST